jgi:hypothetical protein
MWTHGAHAHAWKKNQGEKRRNDRLIRDEIHVDVSPIRSAANRMAEIYAVAMIGAGGGDRGQTLAQLIG